MTAERFGRIAAWILVAFWLGVGVWAFLGPRSFYDEIATFEPYNRHFLHDVGAFSIGLGVVLLLALLDWSAIGAALGGVAVAAVLHEVSHLVDTELGGRDSDLVLLGLLALLAVAGAWATRGRRGARSTPPPAASGEELRSGHAGARHRPR
jgi:hypothetical protein